MDIEIYEASDKARKDTLWKSEETIISNKEKTTTALPTNKKYMIYITTDDGKKFSYSKNADGLSLKHGNNVTVYAAHDFKQY
jgi:FKBP-type peptidyl-prolyl cis-trans isomerase